MKKILVLYATYGSGHKSVANYLYNYLNKKDYELYIIDILEYVSFIGKISILLFNLNIKYRSNHLYSFLYKVFDNKFTTISYKIVFKLMFKLSSLKNRIKAISPDLIISTHFFGTTIKSILKDKTKLISIITDYSSHELWERDEKNTNLFIVANKIIKKSLINKGINKNKIYDYGIPVSTYFKHIQNNQELKKKHKIDNNLKTILFFAGGSLGSNYSYNYFKKLVSKEFECNIIFICGKNIKLKKKCDLYIKNNSYKNVQVHGFTNSVSNFMNISDIVITKPGGISITECLNAKVPMILIPGNGGQENYNSKYVCKNGYGVYSKNYKSLIKNVNKLLNNENLLKKYKNNLKKYSNNNSLIKLEKLVNNLLKEK